MCLLYIMCQAIWVGTRTNGRTKNPQELYLCNSDNFSERKSETLHVYISKSSTVYTCTVNQAFIFIYNVYISHLTYSKVKTMAVKYQTLPIKYQTLPIKYQIQFPCKIFCWTASSFSWRIAQRNRLFFCSCFIAAVQY